MRKVTLFKTAFLGLAFGLLASYMNCSKVSVSDLQSGATVLSSSILDRGNGEFDFSTTVQVGQKTHSDLDLVWVIDNSGSMTQEIAHVRSNLDRFTNSISTQSNLKMALISAPSGSLGLALRTDDPNRFFQINQSVSSTNALRLTASAFCENANGACSMFSSSGLNGKLTSFLRPNSKKVFVVVTDDESEIDPELFSAAFRQTFPSQEMALFGFIGLGASESPCQARTGARYKKLALDTKGETFNICDQDWTPTFSRLAANVLSLVAPVVPLKHPANQVEIIHVILDGQPLDQSQYQVSSSGILINVDLLQPNRVYQVQVRYRTK